MIEGFLYWLQHDPVAFILILFVIGLILGGVGVLVILIILVLVKLLSS